MNKIVKYATAAVLTGAVALAASSPVQARYWHRGHHHHGGAFPFVAGAVIGGLAASAAANSYAYDPGYAYAPGYAYDGPYAYEPGPAFGAYRYYPGCVSEGPYGRADYSTCQ